MAKLGDLFKSLATKAGINVNELATKDPAFASLLAVAAEVPDEIAGQMETTLLTMAAAKNNGELKKHYFAQALDGVDSVIEKVAKKRGIPDEVWTALTGEKNSMKRLEMLDDKIAELQAAKIATTDKTDKTEFQRQIDTLQKELKEAKEAHTAEISRRETEFSTKETGLMINAILAGKNFANKDVPQNVNILVARSLLDQKLAAEGAKVVNDNGVIKILKQDGSDYFDRTHNKVDVGTFLDGVLSTNKMLAITDPGNNSGDNKDQTKDRVIIPGNSDRKINQGLLNANSQALQDLSMAGTG